MLVQFFKNVPKSLLTSENVLFQATDDQTVELAEAFFVGQSVRSNILDVGEEDFTVSH